MNNDDYRAEFEEHKKKIELDDKSEIGTRAELHKKKRKPKKQSRLSMINITLGLFTLIPIIIIVFVFLNIYSSKAGSSPIEQDSPVKYETSGKSEKDGNLLLAEKEEKEKEKKEQEEKEKKELEEQEKKEKKEREEQKKKEQEEQKRIEQEEKKKNELAEKEKIEQEERRKKELAEKEKAEQKPEPKPESRVHVVAQQDTIYSISVTYFGSGAGVDKIKQANGITSNDIFIGQKLIIPN